MQFEVSDKSKHLQVGLKGKKNLQKVEALPDIFSVNRWSPISFQLTHGCCNTHISVVLSFCSRH